MSKYSFLVDIDPKVAKELAANGYVLAVQKATGGTTNPVQWITFPVYATQISVEWTTQYGVYFTITRIDKGAVISQTSKSEASLGRTYEYKNTAFTDIGPGTAGSVAIKSSVPATASFGLSQLAFDSSGQGVLSPIAVAKGVLSGDVVTFTPSETITVYFNRQFTQGGTVIDVSGEALTRTLKAGVPEKYGYDGTWHVLPGVAKLAAEIDVAFPFSEYRVVLAGPLPLWAVQKFFTALLPGSIVNVTSGVSPIEPLVVPVYFLQVFGPNPTAKLEATVGQEIDALHKVAISAGYYELSGHGAVIEAVIPLLTATSTLWNAVFKHAAK